MKITIESVGDVTVSVQGKDTIPFVPYHLRHCVQNLDVVKGFICFYCGTQPPDLINQACPQRIANLTE
jgi:hypothetical protein